MIIQCLNAYRVASAVTDPYFANTVILLSMDGADGSTTFTDESFANRGNATVAAETSVSTSLKKFGTGSARLDGNTDGVGYSDHSDWALGTVDWTMEGWFSFDASFLDSECTLVSIYNTISNQRALRWRYNGALATNALQVSGSSDGSSTTSLGAGNWTPTADTFYHLVLERSGDIFRQYADGSMLSKETNAFTFFDSTANFWIGRTGNTGISVELKGNVDEFRFTRGVARYASDGGFAVPTAAFPRS